MNATQLTEQENTQFTQIHNGMFQNKRKKRFTTHEINNIEDQKHQVILDKATAILRDNNITNFDEKKFLLDFHQRNCGFEKKKYQWSTWHKDDHAVIKYPTYTVIFYLRKDITVHGGDLEYKLNGQKHVHTIKEGDVLQFKGDIPHKPQATSGFGCRDIIVVFIRRT